MQQTKSAPQQTKPVPITSAHTNQLRTLFEGFATSAVKFREKVCEECGWSESTFYKKLRQTPTDKAIFSIAEMEKIRDLAWEVQADLKDRL